MNMHRFGLAIFALFLGITGMGTTKAKTLPLGTGVDGALARMRASTAAKLVVESPVCTRVSGLHRPGY